MIREGLREIFQRKPGRYESVDGIRAFSVVWVILFHVTYAWSEFVSSAHYETVVHSSWNWFWSKGFIAMNPFFVISGFLIGDMLLREYERADDLNLRSFYVRRFFRLAPAYYFVLLGHVVFWLYDSSHFSLRYLWTNVLYINNWFPFRDQPAAWSWSLAVEEQFYIVAPLLILGLMRKRWAAGKAILLLIGLSIAWSYFVIVTKGPFKVLYRPQDDWDAYWHFFDHSYVRTSTRASALLMGVGCAFLKRSHVWQARLRSDLGVGLLTAFVLAISFVSLNPAFMAPAGSVSNPVILAIFNPLSAFSFSCLVLLMQTGRGPGRAFDRFFASKFWFPIAQISYGLYLLHVPVIFFYYSWSPPGSEIAPGPLAARAIVVLLATIVAAIPLSIFVETPMRKLGYRLAKGKAA